MEGQKLAAVEPAVEKVERGGLSAAVVAALGKQAVATDHATAALCCFACESFATACRPLRA
jgi:hypothetical protein